MTSKVLARPQRSVLGRSTLRCALLHRSARSSAATAELLDHIVDRDLPLVRALPADRRARQADRLAAIVLLAQAHRHHAAGWIGRRELRRRSRTILTQLVEPAA